MIKIRQLLIGLIAAYFILLAGIGNSGCGNMAPPMGGPRDSLPPVLVKTTPQNQNTHFNQKRIVIEFDEYVQLDNPFQNVIVSPIPKRQPNIQNRLKTITIEIRDTLEPNTTYTINFGKSVKDVNEGNIAHGLEYVFSTGSYLDSLSIFGKVVLAETGKTDSTLIVVLHPSDDDSAVINNTPRYFAPLNGEGKFVFNHLPPATYSIYAMKDEGGQRKYLSKTQLFAFYDERIQTDIQTDSIYLFAYTEPEDEEGEDDADDIFGQISRQTKRDERLQEQPKFLILGNNLSGGKQDLLGNLTIEAKTAPFKELDTNKVKLFNADSTPVANYRFTIDSTMKSFTVIHNWTPEKNYFLVFDSTFATDTLNLQLRTNDTLSFAAKKESEYGLVRLRFSNLDLSKNPILQFVTAREVFKQVPLTSNEFFQRLFQPGEYELRIVYDENKNGKWDPGSFFENKRQPERVQLIPAKAQVKANWDCEMDIEL